MTGVYGVNAMAASGIFYCLAGWFSGSPVVGHGSRENLSGGETRSSSVDTEPKKQFHCAVSFGRLDPFGSRMSAT
jgi:hypothetical protein